MEGAKKAKLAINSSQVTTRGTWDRTNTEKAQTFPDHLTSVSQPHPSENPPEEEEALSLQLEIPYQLEPLLSRFHRSEVQAVINNLKPKSSPGYDLRTGKILPLALNISHRYSTLLCSQDTSLHNGK
jgi:hypothetical protein